MVDPVGLSAARQAVASIQSTIDQGFAAVLAQAQAAVSSSGAASVDGPAGGSGIGSAGSSVAGSAGGSALFAGSPGGGLSATSLLLGAGAGTAPLPPLSDFDPAGSLDAGTALGPAGDVTGLSPAVLTAGPVQAPGAAPPGGAQVVSAAERYLGVPYVWGGSNPATGFDCSGFVQYVYGQLGIDLPRTSEEQALAGTPVASLAQAQPGDLLLFDSPADGPMGHVGIYLGNGLMIDAPHTGADVRIEPAGTPEAIRRVLPQGAGQAFSVAGSAVPPSMTMAAPAGAYGALFSEATARYHLPAGLLRAVATVESSMNPSAVSPAGAQGLMQLMPSVAASQGVDPLDPAQAIPAAASMLSGYLQRFGSIPLALAAYNAGPGAVERFGGVPPYPQTQAYVPKVMSLMGQVT